VSSSSSRTSTQRLAEFVAHTNYSDLPGNVRQATKDQVLDLVGCALGGIDTDLGLVARRLVASEGESGRAVVIGTGQKTSPLSAAYANARLANILDFEETFMMLGHHAHCALAASLAVAQPARLDGQRLLTAVAVGYEVGARIGQYFGHPLRVDEQGNAAGWYFPGAALGVYAACAAATSSLGLGENDIENAFGICHQYLPVNAGAAWDNSPRVTHAGLPTLKYEDIGWNAKTGLMAALMAAEGITGIGNVFEGPEGLWKSVRPDGNPDLDALVEGLGQDWRLPQTSIKPWPSCRWFHYPLTALDKIVSDQDIDPAAITHVTLSSSPSSCHVSQPSIGPHLVMDASFSLPHSAAMVLMRIPPGVEWFNPTIVHSDAATALRNKVSLAIEPAATRPEAWGLSEGVVRVPSRAVVEAGSMQYEQASEYARGDPWDGAPSYDRCELQAKFRRLAGSVAPLSQKWECRVEDVMQTIDKLEDVPNINDFLVCLSPLA